MGTGKWLIFSCSVKYCICFTKLGLLLYCLDFGGQRQRYENKLATFRRQAEERQDLQLRKEDAGEAGQEDVSTESSEVNDASPHFEIFKVISRDVYIVAVCHNLHLIHEIAFCTARNWFLIVKTHKRGVVSGIIRTVRTSHKIADFFRYT
jgi:hypothetical protein